MKLFSASAYLIASLACVAASSPSDINGVDCPKSPDVTKHDLDKFLSMHEFGPPLAKWPLDAHPDLLEYYNSGPADDDRRRQAFECLLKKLNRDAKEKLQAKLRRPRDTSEGSALNSDWSGGDRSSLTEDEDDFLQEQMASESDDVFGYSYYDGPMLWYH